MDSGIADKEEDSHIRKLAVITTLEKEGCSFLSQLFVK